MEDERHRHKFFWPTNENPVVRGDDGVGDKALAVTYFHMGNCFFIPETLKMVQPTNENPVVCGDDGVGG